MKRRRRCGGGSPLGALAVVLLMLRKTTGFSPPLPPCRHYRQLHVPAALSSWQEDGHSRRQGMWTLPRSTLWEEEVGRRRRRLRRRGGTLGPLLSTTASTTSSSSSSSSSSGSSTSSSSSSSSILADRETEPADDQITSLSLKASSSPPSSSSSRASSSSSSSTSSSSLAASTDSVAKSRKRKRVALTPTLPSSVSQRSSSRPPSSPPLSSRATAGPYARRPSPPPPPRRAMTQLDGEERRVLEQLESLRRRRLRDEFRAITRTSNNQRSTSKGGIDIKRLKERGSTEVLEALVRAAAACQEVEIAWDVMCVVLQRAQELQAGEAAWVPRWDTFSTLMSACRRRRELDLLLRAFKASLPYRGFSKVVLLNILLAGLCDHNRHMDVAAYYLETAQVKWGVRPNEVSWNTLLGAAARGGQHRLFEDMERQMREQGVKGDVTTRNIQLQHLLAVRPGLGLQLFEKMKMQQEEGLREGRREVGGEDVMDLRTMNIMAGHLARTRGFDEAQAMVEEVRRRGLGITPRAVTHNILLDALLKMGRVDEALEYFYGIAGNGLGAADVDGSDRRNGTRHNRGTGGKREGGKGGKESDPPMVDSTTFDILLNGLVQNGRVSTAAVVHEMMRKARHPPTIYTYSSLLRLQKSVSDVYRIWGQARSNCPRLSLPFLNLLVYELGQVHNDVAGALAAFRAILRMGRRPNTISFNSLFSALMKDANATLPAAGLLFGEQQQQQHSQQQEKGKEDEEEGEEEDVEETTTRKSVHGGRQDLQQQRRRRQMSLGDESTYYPTVSALSPEARELLSLLDSLQGRTLLETALAVLRSMYEEEMDNSGNNDKGGGKERESSSSSSVSSPFSARPNARTFTILMAGISKAELGARGTSLCVALYREAEVQGVKANGILCHALLRSFGTDAVSALGFFKRELRVQLKMLDQVNPEEERGGEEGEGDDGVHETEEGREIDGVITAGGNLSLAYMALLYICGISGRPDMALQLLYAMQRDGLPGDRQAWEAFEAGKTAPGATITTTTSVGQLLMGPYESLLRTETMGLGWETGVTRVRIKF